MIKNIEKIIYNLENSKEPLVYFILTFLFSIFIRNFVEIFFAKKNLTILTLDTIAHYSIWYIVLALALISIFYFFTRTPIKKIVKVVLPGFIITISVPILDILIMGGYSNHYNIGYLKPEFHSGLLSRYFTFFGQFNVIGPTIGIIVEIAVVLLLSFFYVFLKTKNLSKGLISTITIYSVIFFLFIVPFHFLLFKKIFNISYSINHILYISYYLIIALPLALINLYLASKKQFKILFSDIRINRILHFSLMFLFGCLIANRINPLNLSLNNIFHAIELLIALIFAFLFSVVTNNFADIKIDQISNKSRPLFSEDISPLLYKIIGWCFMAMAVLYSLPVGFVPCFLIILFMACYFLYSMYPFRFKKYLLLSKVFVAINSLISVALGYFVFQGTLVGFPPHIAIFLLLLMFPINFIDIKDYFGDKAEGIKTLPTILGLKKSQYIIASIWFIFYLGSALFIKNLVMFIPMIFIAVCQFYLITKNNYKETPVFINYLISFGYFLFLYYYQLI